MSALKIGLTGGIGSGKSTVAQIFKELGIPIFFSDQEAKKVYLDDNVRTQVVSLLGEGAYSGPKPELPFIASKVFENKALLSQLNAIIHPAVRKAHTEWHNSQISPYTINEAAILFETGAYRGFDKTILVTAPEEIRLERVIQRDGAKAHEVKARMQKQWPDSQKEKLCNYLIINDGQHSLIHQVQRVHSQLLKLPV